MGRILKRLLIFLIIAALVSGGVYGGLTYYKKKQAGTVRVYPVSDVIVSADYFTDDSQAYGSVTADRMQSVYISGTQNVKEVLVTEGQTVKRGDPLMTYDTTLTQIQLEKAENELAQQELALKRSEQELEQIKRLVPSAEDDADDGGDGGNDDEPTPTPTEAPVQYDPEETPARLSGKGTRTAPYIYLWSTDDALTVRRLLAMFTESGVAPDPTYITDPASGTVDEGDEEAGVETATEALIFRRLGILPYSVFGDGDVEAVEVAEEDNGEELIEGVDDPSTWSESAYSESDPGIYAEDDEHAASIDDSSWSLDDGSGEVESGEEITESTAESEETLLPDENQEIPLPDTVDGSDAPAEEDYSWLNGTPHEVYAVLEIHESNNAKAPVLLRYGLHLIRDGHDVAVRLFNPDAAAETESTADDEGESDASDEVEDGLRPYLPGGGVAGIDYGDDYDDGDTEEDTAPSLSNSSIDFDAHYTAKEIEEMKLEKTREVRDETIAYKMSLINLKEMKAEMADGQVRSKLDGVIKTVRDPDAAYTNSDPVIVVSGGGGYMVNIAISELELDTVAVEQEVEVSSFSNDAETYRGLVKSIADYPSSGGDGWSNGNPNVSYYPCTVRILDDAEFREGDYVSVKYRNNAANGRNSFYVESMFVRSDSSGRYMYVRGEDGKLERRTVVTGRSPDSYVTEIRGGISSEDYVAFPYGTGIDENPDTEISTIDELYS